MRNLLARSTLVVLVILLGTTPGQTAEPLTSATTALSDAALEQRIDFLERRLDTRKVHGQIWYWSWMAINGGSMVGLGISAGLSKHGDNQVNNGVQEQIRPFITDTPESASMQVLLRKAGVLE